MFVIVYLMSVISQIFLEECCKSLQEGDCQEGGGFCPFENFLFTHPHPTHPLHLPKGRGTNFLYIQEFQRTKRGKYLQNYLGIFYAFPLIETWKSDCCVLV